MKTPTPSYQRHRFPPEIISHAVLLDHQFCLTVADEIRNFCVTSQQEDSKQLEEILALAS